MKILSVEWDSKHLKNLIDVGNKSIIIIGECIYPNHPSKFNIKPLGFAYAGLTFLKKAYPKPKRATLEEYKKSLSKFKGKAIPIIEKNNLNWSDDGTLIYSQAFEDKVIKIYQKQENIIRINLYYILKVRIEKFEFEIGGGNNEKEHCKN